MNSDPHGTDEKPYRDIRFDHYDIVDKHPSDAPTQRAVSIASSSMSDKSKSVSMTGLDGSISIDRSLSIPYNNDDDYEIPPTPNVTAEDSTSSIRSDEGNYKIVVLTRVTRFLPSHILSILLKQNYIVRGVVTYADNRDETEKLFSVHPYARRLLFLQEVSPLNQKHWERAFERADYVIHVVTPIAAKSAKMGEEITPTAEVMKKVMAACVKVRSVQRLVLITSVASIAWSPHFLNTGEIFDETCWESEENLTGYAKCQLACEKAAWNFVNHLPEEDRFELVVLNPAFVLGPMIQGKSTHSMAVIKGLMENSFEELPASSLPIVDVRDVAQAAAVALVKKEAIDNRHILYGGTICVEDIAAILYQEFSKQGYHVMTNESGEIEKQERLSKWSCVAQQHSTKNMTPHIEALRFKDTSCINYDNRRMRDILDVDPRTPHETIIETAYSLIFWNMVSKDIHEEDEEETLSERNRRRGNGDAKLCCFFKSCVKGKGKRKKKKGSLGQNRVASWF